MKEIITSSSVHAGQRERPRRSRKHHISRCSICITRIWFQPIALMEPQGVPDPRRSWVLCKSCYQALIIEMRRSPVRSPLRLRIAMGLVAAERSPRSYPLSNSVSAARRDQHWILFIAWGFVTFMLLHLVLIVMLVILWKN